MSKNLVSLQTYITIDSRGGKEKKQEGSTYLQTLSMHKVFSTLCANHK